MSESWMGGAQGAGGGFLRPDNRGTVIGAVARFGRNEDFEELFLRHFDRIRALVADHQEPGLALLAVGLGGACATAWLEGRPGQIATATVGRHGQADVQLRADPSLSLRQLLVIVEPLVGTWTDLRYRLIDLRTPGGMVDERGRRLEALQSEGATFVRGGPCALMCFPTGDDVPWPDEAQAAWRRLPERVYFDDVPPTLQRGPNQPGRPARQETTIRTHAGPTPSENKLVEADEDAVAQLRLRRGDADYDTVLLVGRRALRRGVLLGRYPRCDTTQIDLGHGGHALDHPAISRVHLLILEVGGVVHAMDTASTYGTALEGARVRSARLELGAELELADGAVHLRWVGPGFRAGYGGDVC